MASRALKDFKCMTWRLRTARREAEHVFQLFSIEREMTVVCKLPACCVCASLSTNN